MVTITETSAASQAVVETNIVYGMYSGAALLLDAHLPIQSNGIGIVFIPGSGWFSPPGYGAAQLTASDQVNSYVPPLTRAGYTVFVINYRSTPAFKYPAAVLDTQRAVRFVRYNAKKFGIDPARIGGVGGSSGAHLVSLLGTKEGAGDKSDPDMVNRESSKLQAVVARAVPADFLSNGSGNGIQAIANFLGVSASQLLRNSGDNSEAWAASPINYVTSKSAPFLLIHGDTDKVIPFEQSERLAAVLKKMQVPVKLLRIPGGGHHPTFKGANDPPDFLGEMVTWFDLHLKKSCAHDRLSACDGKSEDLP
jgi:acetyl esterase/lipase